MDEKNAYIELVKQNRAKHRAKLKASKEIKELEQKKEKVILKYEQAAKDNTCITFHQYCRKKWASEAGIESVPDDDETDAKKGKFDLIITREVSRFARNTVDTLSYIRELKAVGVNLFFINDGINTATDYGELRLTIMSSLAQDESRKISERVKAGQEISREKHVLYGNGNILGYRRENGTYVPDPDQAQTVKLIYQMYSTGKVGLQKVAAELYRLGRLDASGHVSWDASKVSRVLHNATYKGCICYNKSHSDGYLTQKRVKNLDESSYVYVKGDFEPLVSEETWDRCQQILTSKSERVIDENGKKHKYILYLKRKMSSNYDAARHLSFLYVEVTAEDKTGETFTGWTVEGVEIADKGSKKLNFKIEQSQR